MRLAASAAVVASGYLQSQARCDAVETPPNPLRHGIPEKTLQAYVKRLIAENPDCNNPLIPDVVERQLYASVVRIIADSIYFGVGKLHGVPLLGNLICLRLADDAPPPPRSADRTPVSRDALEQVVDNLLTNESLNQSWLPDAVERALYLNILNIAFLVIDDFASALSLSILGFELVLDFRPKAATGGKRPPVQVDETVVRQLADETLASSANIALIPDNVERRVYENIYRLTLGVLYESFSSVGLACFGTEVGMYMRPAVVAGASASQGSADGAGVMHQASARLSVPELQARLADLRREERLAIEAHQTDLAKLKKLKEDVKAQLRAVGCGR